MNTKLKDIVRFPDLIQNKIDYWSYLTSDFENHLNNYLPVFEKSRAEKKIIPSPEEWSLLPFGPFAKDSSWKWRRQSLSIIQNLIPQNSVDCTLEIGPWNGWLTKYLAKKSNVIVGTDYFTSPFDGIENLQSLSENIIAVQCNVHNIGDEFKKNSFDLIVLNHCLSYTENPVDFIQRLIPLLKENGKIISIGNTFYKDSKKKILENKQHEESFLEKYNLNLYIQPVKGYLDTNDKKLLINLGFKIKNYPFKLLQNLYSKFNPKAPSYNYIIYYK